MPPRPPPRGRRGRREGAGRQVCPEPAGEGIADDEDEHGGDGREGEQGGEGRGRDVEDPSGGASGRPGYPPAGPIEIV